jgi:hypothetical protein
MRKRKKVDEQARNAKEKEMRASSGDKKKKTAHHLFAAVQP